MTFQERASLFQSGSLEPKLFSGGKERIGESNEKSLCLVPERNE
jgi:hypothetical protein